MRRRAQEEAPLLSFDALEIGRLTCIGLILAAIGWALLLGETALADFVGRQDPARCGADLSPRIFSMSPNA